MAIDPDVDFEADDQEGAETFDETNLTEDGEDIARPDVMRNVYDVTVAEDDADDEEGADADDFDPDTLDEEDLERLTEADDGVDDDDGPTTRDPGDLVAEDGGLGAWQGGDDDLDAEDDLDLAESGTAVSRGTGRTDARRDEVLDDTYPASDPAPANPGSD